MDGSRLGHKVGGKRERERENLTGVLLSLFITRVCRIGLDCILPYWILLCCVMKAERVDRSGKQSNSRREGATGS